MQINNGAEALIEEKEGMLLKERIKKEYRINEIDEKLRLRRTRLEANLLREARRIGVLVPRVLDVRVYTIEMEKIEGCTVKDAVNEKTLKNIGKEIGKSIALLHEYNIIHGDLTTSNMILKNEDNQAASQNHDRNNSSLVGYDIYFIDFGLGFNSSRIEDKAIDLYLLFHSIEATHWNILEKFWESILLSYKSHFKGASEVIKTLDKIEKRGRYK